MFLRHFLDILTLKTKPMEIKPGMKFRDLKGIKCHIVSTFTDDGRKVITYKYWLKSRQKWVFETEYENLFLIAFDYGWHWID